ncbi:hypothetical protein B5M42_004895 [Paenibacillus athensensis]|uniref:RHS repeat-associated core domain-containing protein n=1 Tax=Paenibacillus athensensis TaxID=1967502 RepID=UPI00142FB3E3|nr:RHS repeat-associated core domain-containing protein [Paenibacillus athensensis]MCD1258176.1 hypothetical protein [Paenibacillus athensensis]
MAAARTSSAEPESAAVSQAVYSEAPVVDGFGGSTGSFTADELASIRELPGNLKKLAAYYYPELTSLLTQDELLDVLAWSDSEVEALVRDLSKKEQKQLRQLTPSVFSTVDVKDRKADKLIEDKSTLLTGKQVASGMSAMTTGTPDSQYSPLEPYRYQVSRDGYFDPLYRVATQQDVDVRLPGKHGLDLVLARTYSSMSADAKGVNSAARIASGWKLLVPELTMNRCPEGGNCAVFSLEDGSSYVFKRTPSSNQYTLSADSPYQNAKVVADSTGRMWLTLDNKITYLFKYDASWDKGCLISKSNEFGDTITYNGYYPYSRMISTITDSVNRTITFSESNSQITGLEVRDATGTLTHKINYENTLRQTSLTLRKRITIQSDPHPFVTETVFYTTLDRVTDVIGNRTLHTYTYYDPRVADFNQSDTLYDNYDTQVALDVVVNGEAIEKAGYMSVGNYEEMAYILLKEATDDIGFTVQYMYDSYNSNWYTNAYTDYAQSDLSRGTVRSYGGRGIRNYQGYHPVSQVFYKYTNNVGQAKVLSQSLLKMSNRVQEMWIINRNGSDPVTGYASRFKNVSSYRSGDRPVTTIITNYGDYSIRTETGYTAVNYGKFRQDYSLTSYSPISNGVDWTENGSRYLNAPTEYTTYQYDEGKTRPYLNKSFTSDSLGDPTPAAIKSALLSWGSRTLPAGMANYATITKQETNNVGFPTYQEDALGNTITYTYGYYSGNGYAGTYLTSKKLTAADNLTASEDSYTYLAPGKISTQTHTSTYRNPANPSEVRTDTTLMEFLNYNSSGVPTLIKESSSGNQYGQQPMVKQTALTYDAAGIHVLSETTSLAMGSAQTPTPTTVSYAYDNRDRLTRVTYPDGSKAEYQYDFKDRAAAETFTPASGSGGSPRTIQYTYNDTSRQVVAVLPDGENQLTTYTPYGDVEKQERKAGSSTKTTMVRNFDSTGTRLLMELPYNDYNHRTAYTYDKNGHVKSIMNGLNQSTYVYTANTAYRTDGSSMYPQSTIRTVEPDGKETWVFKDRSGRVTSQREASATKNRTTSFTYTPLGQVAQQQVTGGGITQTTQYGYDADGHLIYLKDDQGQVYQYVYNRMGSLIATYINGTLKQSSAYNEAGWLLSTKNAANLTDSYTYQVNGLVATRTDKDNQRYSYTYTPYNELSTTTIQNSAGTTLYTEQNTYDSATRLLTSATNSDNETQGYHYDIWKRLDYQQVAGRTYLLGYDSLDNLNRLTYPDGKSVTYTYDNLNRIASVAYPEMGVQPVSYTYSTAANENNMTSTYPALGASQEKKVDAFKELISVRHLSGTTPTWNETFGYDGMGNITSMNRNGAASTYTYDKLNRIDVETVPGGVKNYDYDSRGNIQSIQHNGTAYVSTYDSTDRLQTVNTPNGPSSYTYDNRGNRLTSTGNGRSGTYTYTALNELKTYTNTVTGATYGYTYYPDGLRATKGIVGGDPTRYVYLNGKVIEELGSQNMVKARNIWGNELLYRQDFTANKLSNGSFEATPAPAWFVDGGQIVSGGTDGSKMIQFTNATTANATATQYVPGLTAGKQYVIEGSIKTQNVTGTGAFIWLSYRDASMNEIGGYWLGTQTGTSDWKRASMRVTLPAGTTSMYVGAFLVNASGTAWFDDLRVTEVGGSAQQSGYYFYNGHGDVVAVKDSSGSTLNTYDYDIWGNLTSKTETMPQPFRYAGEPQDDESGLIYLRARYYDPAVARFITEDTYTGKIDNPLSLNLYTYAWNNPSKYVDRTGNNPAAVVAGAVICPECALAVAAVGVVAYGGIKLYKWWASSDDEASEPLSDEEIIDKELSRTQKDQIDNIDKNLDAVNDEEHLDAYEIEKKGDYVRDANGNIRISSKTGKPFNHVQEVEQSEGKISKMVEKLKNAQKSPSFQKDTSEVTKKAVQDAIDRGQKFIDKVKAIRENIKNGG